MVAHGVLHFVTASFTKTTSSGGHISFGAPPSFTYILKLLKIIEKKK